MIKCVQTDIGIVHRFCSETCPQKKTNDNNELDVCPSVRVNASIFWSLLFDRIQIIVSFTVQITFLFSSLLVFYRLICTLGCKIQWRSLHTPPYKTAHTTQHFHNTAQHTAHRADSTHYNTQHIRVPKKIENKSMRFK